MKLHRRANVLAGRDFRLLLAGQSASNLGTNIVTVAMAIYITRRTGSTTDLGVILAAQTAPFIVLLLLGGVYADRLQRRQVMIVTDLVRGALHAALATLIIAGTPTIAQIAVIEGLWGTAWAFFQPAYTGLLPETVTEPDIKVAQSLMIGSWNASMLLGPAIGTALVLGAGAAGAFAVDAASFLASAVLLVPVRPRRRSPAIAAGAVANRVIAASAPSSPALRSTRWADALEELREGFAEVRSRAWVWGTILAYTVTMLCFFATWNSLAPQASSEVYGSVAIFGVLTAVSGAGAVAGSLLGSVWHPRRPLLTGCAIGMTWPASALLLALGVPLWTMIAWALLAGLSSAFLDIVWETALAHNIPPHALSRVSSYDWMGSMALLPLGYALAGPLAGALGTRAVLGVGGAVGVIAVALSLLPRSTRELQGSFGISSD